MTNYGVKQWMILNTDKLGSKGYIFFLVSLISQYLAFQLRDTGKQMERGNIIEDLTFKLCQLRKT